jgi:hypothetical protein
MARLVIAPGEPHHRRDVCDDDAGSWRADPPSGVMPHRFELMTATIGETALAGFVLVKFPEARNGAAGGLAAGGALDRLAAFQG